MSRLTIHLPDDKHLRLRELAKHHALSVNKLIEELATISIAEFDAETRFRALAARGSAKKGIAILDKLNASFARKGSSQRHLLHAREHCIHEGENLPVGIVRKHSVNLIQEI